MAGEDRPELGAMAMLLGRRLLAMEQPILARHGVTMWAYIVLTALRDRPMRTQAALAASIGADKTRLIPVLDELQRRELIEREPDPADRRVRLLRLTAAGRELQRAVHVDIRAEEEVLLADIPPANRPIFLATLEAITRGSPERPGGPERHGGPERPGGLEKPGSLEKPGGPDAVRRA